MQDSEDARTTVPASWADPTRSGAALRCLGEAFVSTDATGRVSDMNPVAEALCGITLAEARGQPWDEILLFMDRRGRFTGAMDPDAPPNRCLFHGGVHRWPEGSRLMSVDGREVPVLGTAAPIGDEEGNVFGVAVLVRECSEPGREAPLPGESEDALTGLPDRPAFEARLSATLAPGGGTGSEHALILIEVDDFRLVTDTGGVAAGNALLQELGGVLRAALRLHDTVARLRGTTFGVLLEGCPPDAARRLAETLRSRVEAVHFEHAGQRLRLGASVGLYPIDATTRSAADALSRADAALRAARQGGGNRVHVHRGDDGPLATRQGELRWIARLEHAVEHDDFVLHAQPIVALHSDDEPPPLRFEVLLRLRQDGARLIPPDGFMAAAERHHQAVAVDRWVVARVLTELAARPGALARIRMCCINLSAQSLSDRLFHAFVARRIEEHGIPAGKLCFEIGEAAATASVAQARRFMDTLRGLGCRFALDDFGSGLSSLTYLRELPVDLVKIDPLFVRNMAADSVDFAMVRAIHEVASMLGRPTVGECVENGIVADELRALGVDYGQGFHLAPPVPLAMLLDAEAAPGPDPGAGDPRGCASQCRVAAR